MDDAAPRLLSRDRALLDFERDWRAHQGGKEAAVRARFKVSAARYYQLLNRLADDPAADAYDPLTVRRLRRRRDERDRRRTARALGERRQPDDRSGSLCWSRTNGLPLMARHADPNDHSFQRSLARAAGRALLLLALVAALTAGVARLGTRGGGGDDVTRPPGGPLSATTASPSQTPVEDAGDVLDDLTETPRETVAITPAPSEPPVPDDAPTPTEEPGVPPTTEAVASASPVPAGMTVQVLDGVGDEERTRSAARRLEELGYEVVAVNVSSRQAADTSVLYTEGNRATAEQLVATDPRFGTVGPNDRFAADVTLHVVIGADWPA